MTSFAITATPNGRFGDPIRFTVKSLGVMIGTIRFRGGAYQAVVVRPRGWSLSRTPLGAYATPRDAGQAILEAY